jgi:integrase
MIQPSTAASSSHQLTGIPPVPAVVRYYDDFTDSYAQVHDADQHDKWIIAYDGISATLDFTKFNAEIRPVVKSWCAHRLGSLSPRTVQYYYYGIRKLAADDVCTALMSAPQGIRSLWKQLHSQDIGCDSLQALQNLLSFCCHMHVNSWAQDWSDLVSQLPLPKVDKYASVRKGDVFLRTDEEAAIVRSIDDVCNRLETNRSSINDDLLETTGILVCGYQFGFRPKQIAMLEVRNLRIWNDGLDHRPAVHLTFTMIKQRSAKRVFQMVRRIKRDWSAIFTELASRASNRRRSGDDKLFCRTPREVVATLADHLENILGSRRTGTELRHTAAQRLVDSGASEEELAAFMGHTDLNTGLPYFTASPSQGERVNRAFGISDVYHRVAKIAHDRFVSREELVELKGDQQIAGVPHGIPISGIGGCSSGQPTCPYNPVLSCYGCSRFMPLSDIQIHTEVLEDLRGILKFFYTSSRAERGSPAFQLGETIAKVQVIITELGAESIELLP